MPKKKRPVQSEDGGEGTTQTREGDNSPLFPSSSSGRGRGRGRGRARITERDILVPKRNPRRSINSHDKKENNLLKDKKEKEKPTKDDAMTNGVLVSLPEVRQVLWALMSFLYILSMEQLFPTSILKA